MIKAGRYSVHIDGNDEEAAKSLEVVTKDDVVIADEADEIWRCEKEYARVWTRLEAERTSEGRL